MGIGVRVEPPRTVPEAAVVRLARASEPPPNLRQGQMGGSSVDSSNERHEAQVKEFLDFLAALYGREGGSGGGGSVVGTRRERSLKNRYRRPLPEEGRGGGGGSQRSRKVTDRAGLPDLRRCVAPQAAVAFGSSSSLPDKGLEASSRGEEDERRRRP